MIHTFAFDGIFIVMDVNSGAVHAVDEPAYYIIKALETAHEEDVAAQYLPVYGVETVKEVLQEAADLKANGMLFAPDPLPHGFYNANADGAVKALCLHLAHDCNLRCRYCFASQGDFGGDRGLMSKEVGRAAIDFLMHASGSRQHVEVDFFGGEPLLNVPVMEDLVEYGRARAGEAGKLIKFTLTTNAMLLDAKMQRFIIDNDLAVVLSVDGRPQVHDHMRPTPSGGGSYRRIMERCTEFVRLPFEKDYYIRGTFTRHNLDFAEDVRHLAEAGFDHLSVEPVIAGAEMDYALREGDLPVIFAEYDKLTRYLLERHRQGRPVEFFHFNVDLEDGPCLAKRLTGCSAGTEYLAVAPTGEMYPCHQFVGRHGFQVGTVFNGVEKGTTNMFSQAHIYNKQACQKCWARFHCSGGCHANALAFNGDLLEPYGLGCELAKKRLECALYLKVCTAAG
ncbi:MAG: thioether cross-link-forming SCIFF peptide maturase [Desulfotomaculaceae bacterium]